MFMNSREGAMHTALYTKSRGEQGVNDADLS
jgi:hypothetical protein